MSKVVGLVFCMMLALTGAALRADEGSQKYWDFHEMITKPGENFSGISAEELLSEIRNSRKAETHETRRSALLDKLAAVKMDEQLLRTFKNLKTALATNDARVVADLINFPVEDKTWMAHSSPDSKMKREVFLEAFKRIFPDYAIQEIRKLSVRDLDVKDGECSFSFKMSEDVTDNEGNLWEAAVGIVTMKQTEDKWTIIRFAMAE